MTDVTAEGLTRRLAEWLVFWPTDSVLKCHGDEEEERQTGLREEELPAESIKRRLGWAWVWAGDTNAAQYGTTRYEAAQQRLDSGGGGRGGERS